eukprot:COSAG02_NODE_187_length_30377_cov_3.636271_22_plen_81_part_00
MRIFDTVHAKYLHRCELLLRHHCVASYQRLPGALHRADYIHVHSEQVFVAKCMAQPAPRHLCKGHSPSACPISVLSRSRC